VEFTNLIDEFPRSSPAVDAAFRKAFIHFAKSEFEQSFRVYQNLERYHSEEVEKLKLRNESEGHGRFLDRIYYAETIFLNGLYDESARLFQDLANLSPKDPLAPILLVRLADTYFERGQFKAAEHLYQLVIKDQDGKSLASSFGKVHLADLWFLTSDVRAHRENERLYVQAREEADKMQQIELAAFAAERWAGYLLHFGSVAKPQTVL